MKLFIFSYGLGMAKTSRANDAEWRIDLTTFVNKYFMLDYLNIILYYIEYIKYQFNQGVLSRYRQEEF